MYSLNGEETYLEGKQKDISDETILLDLKKVFRMGSFRSCSGSDSFHGRRNRLTFIPELQDRMNFL